MNHCTSADDQRFLADLEPAILAPEQFDHRAHVRAAYIYLTALNPDEAADRMRDTLLRFLSHHEIDVSK
jgi:hypothetical protein